MGPTIKKRKGSPNYWLFAMVNGQRLDRSLRTPVKKFAEEIAKEIYRKALEETFGVSLKRNRGITLGTLIEKYSAYSKTNNRTSTYMKKRFNLDNILSFFGDIPLGRITTESIENFKTKRLNEVGPATVNRDLAALRHALHLAVTWGYLTRSPADPVKTLQEPPPRDRVLTIEEEERLLKACGKPLRHLILAAINTGMRLGELLALEWQHVNFEKPPLIKVVDSKNNESRFVPVNTILYNIWADKEPKEGKVFTSSRGGPYKAVSTSFRLVCDRAGIQGFRFHDCRHTFSTRLAEAGIPDSTIATLLGHKSLSMTRRYTHLTFEHLAEVVELLTRNSHKGESGEKADFITP